MKNLEHAEISNLRNDEHFDFMYYFDELIKEKTPAELGIADIYPAFKSAFDAEDKIMKIELGSSKSASIRKHDKLRGKTWNSINRGVNATILCPIEAEVQSALVIKRIIDLYGDKRNASYNAETGSTTNLTNDLLSAVNRPHLVTIHILSWVEALQSENNEIRILLKERNEELGIRESGNVSLIRETIDPLYQKIITRINATIELNLAKPAVESFVNTLNDRIRYDKNILTSRESKSETKPPVVNQ